MYAANRQIFQKIFKYNFFVIKFPRIAALTISAYYGRLHGNNLNFRFPVQFLVRFNFCIENDVIN